MNTKKQFRFDDIETKILSNVKKLEEDITNKKIVLTDRLIPETDSKSITINNSITSNPKDKLAKLVNKSKLKSKLKPKKSVSLDDNEKQSVKFEDSNSQFSELLQEILEPKSENSFITNNNQNQEQTNYNHKFKSDKFLVARLRLMSKKLYDVKAFDISEFYNTYENSEMTEKDQLNFYENISDFIFGHGESWKLLTQDEYDYYDNIIFYRYDSYFDFERSGEPLLLNLFNPQSTDSSNNFLLKLNLSFINDSLRIDGFVQLFDTKNHKLCYNNNSYGDLFGLIDNILMVEVRKRLNNIPKELIETWFENQNHTLDSDMKIEDYVYKYVDKHGWLNTNCFYLFKSIEIIHQKMNEILEEYQEFSGNNNMIEIIYDEIYKNIEESISNHKSNFDTVLIELQSKSVMYKKEEMIHALSEPLKSSITAMDPIDNDVFEEVKFMHETNSLLEIDIDSEDGIDNRASTRHSKTNCTCEHIQKYTRPRTVSCLYAQASLAL